MRQNAGHANSSSIKKNSNCKWRRPKGEKISKSAKNKKKTCDWRRNSMKTCKKINRKSHKKNQGRPIIRLCRFHKWLTVNI